MMRALRDQLHVLAQILRLGYRSEPLLGLALAFSVCGGETANARRLRLDGRRDGKEKTKQQDPTRELVHRRHYIECRRLSAAGRQDSVHSSEREMNPTIPNVEIGVMP